MPLLRLPDRTLTWIGAGALMVFAGSSSVDGLPGPDITLPLPVDLDTASGALAGRTFLAAVQLLGTPLVVLSLLTPAVVGVLLARRRVLERPAEHRRLLRRLAVGGFCISVPGAVPMVLASVQVWQPSTVTGLLAGALHALTGLAGAVAFVALVALVAAALEQRAAARVRDRARRGPLSAVVAVGQRSLTCYLLQSVLFVPLMAPWAAGLGVGAGTAFAAAVGTGIYLVTVAVAVALDRTDRQGPAEAVLRRLTYGPRLRSGGSGAAEVKPGRGSADTTTHDVRARIGEDGRW